VIDRGGVIRAVDADPDYTRRSEPADTVEILKGLREARRERRARGTQPKIETREIVFDASVDWSRRSSSSRPSAGAAPVT